MKINEKQTTARQFSSEPQDSKKFLETFDKFYTATAGIYNFAVKVMPFWKRWLACSVPHIRGKRVLDISFGTGYLLTQFAGDFDAYGIDYNRKMVEIAKQNLEKKNLSADLRQGNVENLPYEANCFDTILNTMAFTGYPDGVRALSEMKRVLRPDGRLIVIDVNYPADNNWIGVFITRCWQAGGDIIRDMGRLLEEQGFEYQDFEIGGFGSVHLYLCEKPDSSRSL